MFSCSVQSLLAAWVFAAFAIALGYLAAAPTPKNPIPPKEEKPFIEYDFAPVPPFLPNGAVIKYDVYTTYKEFYPGQIQAGKSVSRETVCDHIVGKMQRLGFTAVKFGDLKIRVYGYTHEDTFYPVTKGTISSPDLKKDEMPIVTQPGAEVANYGSDESGTMNGNCGCSGPRSARNRSPWSHRQLNGFDILTFLDVRSFLIHVASSIAGAAGCGESERAPGPQWRSGRHHSRTAGSESPARQWRR